MKKRLILKVLGLLLLLPMFSGCNDTDDVAGIFTGKTWKLTYITKANGHGWYNFPDIADESNVMEYINGKKTFMLVFSGSVEDDIIQGTFTGSGAINTNGTWSANGKNQEFGMKVKKELLSTAKTVSPKRSWKGGEKQILTKDRTAGTCIFIIRLIKKTSAWYSLQTKIRTETRWTRKRNNWNWTNVTYVWQAYGRKTLIASVVR